MTATTVEGLAKVLETWNRLAAPLPSLTTMCSDVALDEHLSDLGFVPAGQRPFAVIDLPRQPNVLRAGIAAEFQVREAQSADERQIFLDTLAAGYESSASVRDFMSAEHSVGEVRRFVGWRGGRPMAAAAMSSHRNVMVLGGAAVLRGARGHGGQAQLLQYRVLAAEVAGYDAVIATAAAGSPSLRNLGEAGFETSLRQAWRQTGAA